MLFTSNHSLSKHGLETPLKSLFYLFVRVYAVLCTVNEHIVFQYNELLKCRNYHNFSYENTGLRARKASNDIGTGNFSI